MIERGGCFGSLDEVTAADQGSGGSMSVPQIDWTWDECADAVAEQIRGRNRAREDAVPAAAIERMVRRWDAPTICDATR